MSTSASSSGSNNQVSDRVSDDNDIDIKPSIDKKRSHRTYDHDDPAMLDYRITSPKKRKTSHPSDNVPTWSCSLCTLQNRLTDERCVICSAPKPGSKQQQHHTDDNKEYKQKQHNNDDSDNNGTGISKLIQGLQSVRLNTNNHQNNDIDDDALHSMDGVINKLHQLQFDTNANTAINQSSKMNDIIHTLSSLDVNNSNKCDINSMVKDINAEINGFIIELQQSLYWRFKIKKETTKFKKLMYRDSIDRIIRILTFYADNHSVEYNLFQYVNDDESDYKHLKTDYQHIIMESIISKDNIIRMKKQFALFIDYVSQTLPICNIKECLIYKRYHDDGKDEDDDIFDDKVLDFQDKMDVLHCYLFHSERCGIMVNDKEVNLNGYKQAIFGGEWYWFYDAADIKWIPYTREDQILLNTAWRNNVDELGIVGNRYKVSFKRKGSNNSPCGWQYEYNKPNGWKRRIMYGVRDKDGLLNGIRCEKQPK